MPSAMRRFCIAISVAACCVALAGFALAADPEKKPDGFRGIAWGTEVSGLKDMVLVEKDGDFADYDRKGDKLDLGGMPVAVVTYGFYKGQFYHAAIGYEGATGFDAVQEHLVAKYGRPDALTERTDSDGRAYVLSAWNWPGYAYIGHRRYKDGTAGRLFYFYSPLVEASKAAAASAVATAAMAPKSPGAAGPSESAARPGKTSDREKSAPPAQMPAQKTAPKVQAEAPTPREEAARAVPEPETPKARVAPDVSEKIAAVPGNEAGATHVIVKGDMLSALAKRYGVPRDAILAANPGITPTNLKLGQTLRIPGGKGVQAPEAAEAEAPRAKAAVEAEPATKGKSEATSASEVGTAPVEKAASAATPTPEVAPADVAATRPGPKEASGPVAATKPAGQETLSATEAALAHAEHAAPQTPEPRVDPAVKKAAPGTHVIAQGDMISALAKRYGVTEKAILKANPGLKPGNLQLGKVIRLPAGAKAGATPDVAPAAQAATPEPKPEPAAEVPASPARETKASEPAPEVPAVSPEAKAAPKAEAAPAQAGKPREHVLEFEDTLSGLAKRYGVTTAAIMKANPGLDPKKLKPGKKIKIP